MSTNETIRNLYRPTIFMLKSVVPVLAFVLLINSLGVVDNVNSAYALDPASYGIFLMSENKYPYEKGDLHERITFSDIPPFIQIESEATAIGYINYDGNPVAGATVSIIGPTTIFTTTTQLGPLSDEPYFTVNLSAPPLDALPDDLLKMVYSYSNQENITTFKVVSGQQELYGHLSSTCGPTDVNNPLITTLTIWTPECGPYRVHQNLMIESTVTLTVIAGTTVEFDPGSALLANGFLSAEGTANALITFTSPQQTPGDWSYIQINNAAILYGTLVEYAGGADLENSAAVRVDSGTAVFDNVIVRSSARDGIQVYNDGDVQMNDMIVMDNTGWGIVQDSTTFDMKIYNSTVQSNGDGGIRINNAGVAEIYSNYIADNMGSGVDIRESTIYVNIAGNIICRNQESDGGAINFEDSSGTIENNLIWDNLAGRGGGLFVFRADPDIKNNFILENRATNTFLGGGGIYLRPYPNQVHHNVIVGNTSAGDGGGIYSLAEYNRDIFTNSILRNHAAGQGGAIYADYIDYIHTSIEGNTILENTAGFGQGAIYLTAKSDPINNNNIYNNSDYTLFYDSPYSPENLLDAQQNWWGADIMSEIPPQIWDWYDDATLSEVDYSNPLTLTSIIAPVTPPQDFVFATDTSTVTLGWSPNLETDLAGYKLYFSISDQLEVDAILGNVTALDLGMTTGVTITNVPVGIYNMAITAYDLDADGDKDWRQGHESWFSQSEMVIIGDPPQANFTADPLSGTLPLTVIFTDTSTGVFNSWYWIFGDGETSTEQHPTHIYTDTNVYTVTLAVDGPTGIDTEIKSGYITVFPRFFIFLPLTMR